MNILTYALLCYGLTAAISLLAIAVALGINKALDKDDAESDHE